MKPSLSYSVELGLRFFKIPADLGRDSSREIITSCIQPQVHSVVLNMSRAIIESNYICVFTASSLNEEFAIYPRHKSVYKLCWKKNLQQKQKNRSQNMVIIAPVPMLSSSGIAYQEENNYILSQVNMTIRTDFQIVESNIQSTFPN